MNKIKSDDTQKIIELTAYVTSINFFVTMASLKLGIIAHSYFNNDWMVSLRELYASKQSSDL